VALWAWPQLPPVIPTRWNIRGEVDGHGPAEVIFLIGPGLMALEIMVFSLLLKFAPPGFRVDQFRETWLDLMVVMVGMTGYCFAVLAIGLATPGFDLARGLMGGIGLSLLLVGNLLGKSRRNLVIGIRTPWTLASEAVWNATQRLAARCMVAAGGLALVFTFADAPFIWAVAAAALALVVPAIYSFAKSRSIRKLPP
jgi:uncharacterized membrane protein